VSYPTGIEVDEVFAYLDDIARGQAPTPAPCHKLLGGALVLRSEVVSLRKQLERAIEQRDAEEADAMHSGGILSDVCDIAFADPQRAMRDGYDGIRERVALLADLPDPEEWPFCCTTCGQGLGVGDVDTHECLKGLREAFQRDKEALRFLARPAVARVHKRLFGDG
jgi:hypothetical protein